MTLENLVNTTALHIRFKVYAAIDDNMVLLADCRADEIKRKLDDTSLERQIVFTSILKDDKGIALCVLLAC